MMPGKSSNNRVFVFVSVMVVSIVGLLLLPPITQNQNYHDFADQRTILGIPHFWNVVSNLPFIAVGAAGLRQCRREPAIAVLFLGILTTGFGSGYYHLDPNDRTLFWDRLPMAIGFMAILAIAIEERLDAKTGAFLLWPLIALGVVSLLLWRLTGDLRLYAWVQFFPCVAIPVLFVLYSPKFSRDIVLAHCCSVICACKVVRVLRRSDLFFRLNSKRTYFEAHCRGRSLFRHLAIFPDAAAYPDRGLGSRNSGIGLGSNRRQEIAKTRFFGRALRIWRL